MFAIHAFEIIMHPYVPGSMRKMARYRAAVFVVATVMIIPVQATAEGMSIEGERAEVRPRARS
jgi:hypothetical protein